MVTTSPGCSEIPEGEATESTAPLGLKMYFKSEWKKFVVRVRLKINK